MPNNEEAFWQGVNNKLQAKAQLPYFQRLWLEGEGDEDYNTVAEYLAFAKKEASSPTFYFVEIENAEEKQEALDDAFDAWRNLDLIYVRDHIKEFWGL
jgi:hypothetical protein